jgi:hypothetical protein
MIITPITRRPALGPLLGAWLFFAATTASSAGGLTFDRVVIDDNFPGAYQVEVADVNGDGKPDVVAVGGGTCAWYENPSWKKRIVSSPKQTPGVISSATRDIDGDGKAEVAIAYEFSMNEPTRGKLLLARQSGDGWSYTPVADLGSIHRLRWGDMDGDKKPDLVVAPIFGPAVKPPAFQEEPAHIVVFKTGGSADPARWSKEPLGNAPVLHAIDVLDLDGDGRSDVLGASNLGVTLFSLPTGVKVTLRSAAVEAAVSFSSTLAQGAPGVSPKKGSSEVHVGKLKDGRRFLATVEPWHGTDVAVYLSESVKPLKFGARNVIDSTLKEGHALWVADVDGDGDDEVFAGFRGPGTSVLAFDFNGKSWDRTVVDPKIAAQDLRGGDLDGDGTPDVVAVGGSTHNVVWYRPRKRDRLEKGRTQP